MPDTPNQNDRIATFVRLLTQNERQVYAYIFSLVPNWADADELLQETNVRLWEQFDKFEIGSNFGAWARTIAHYQVLTFRKRTGRERVHFGDAFLEAIAQEQAEEPPAHISDQRAALANCIEQVSEPNRRLLQLVYEAGRSVKLAASELNRPVAATYKALARVRKALHTCIEQSLSREDAS